MKKTFVLAATTVLAVSLAGMAHATTNGRRNIQQQVVSYADLNLESEADAATLLGRIEAAARKVCGLDRAAFRPFELQFKLQVCAKEATARAVNDVNAPLLTGRQIIVRNDR
jgi:UrcA family protein